MKNLISLIRPSHYVKNIFILLPLFFIGQFNNTAQLIDGLIAFAAFSLTASSIYIFNDFRDIQDDRKHPKKKYRPLASGLIKKDSAILLMIILAAVGFFLMANVSTDSITYGQILSVFDTHEGF